ncbi:hypothetical protein GCM10023149_11570 [Mucilaginibacter gynuensis]|uniref:GLPGLI family protein n=1 Tax=Mucilaginibacter gynuensis TaxID=1302236 RepID=A0ABP8G0Y6_9SPHI
MKRLLLSILALFIFCITKGQNIKVVKNETSYSVYVKGENFDGVIFSEKYAVENLYELKGHKRFTPSIKEILSTEKLLASDLNSFKYCHDFVVANLSKYTRQYLGYINYRGEKMIYINAAWKPDLFHIRANRESPLKKKTWYNQIVLVEDGGHYFWNASLNLSQQKIITFTTNGA